MLVYPIGRTYLIELLHSELQALQVRFVDGPPSQRAYAQLERLETEMRETGVVYSCPPGQHDDLGISCAMLAWAARHPHLEYWVGNVRRPPRRRQTYGWGASLRERFSVRRSKSRGAGQQGRLVQRLF